MFHEDKLIPLTKFILCHKWVKAFLGNMIMLTDQEIQALYPEKVARKALMLLLLVSGNGARQSVIENMTVKEFEEGKFTDGVFSTLVWKHKTMKKGLALLGFFIEGVYEATLRYLSVYRPYLFDDHEVFGTEGIGPTKWRMRYNS